MWRPGWPAQAMLSAVRVGPLRDAWYGWDRDAAVRRCEVGNMLDAAGSNLYADRLAVALLGLRPSTQQEFV